MVSGPASIVAKSISFGNAVRETFEWLNNTIAGVLAVAPDW